MGVVFALGRSTWAPRSACTERQETAIKGIGVDENIVMRFNLLLRTSFFVRNSMARNRAPAGRL